MIKLDFCLAGAPKCGTTAMARYLSEHPEVDFSVIKEPYFYADDLGRLRAAQGVTESEEFEKQFRGTGGLRGEGSTLYLFSEVAVERLLSQNPDARLVVMLRRPSEVVRSFYQQMCKYGFEDATTLREAWEWQRPRQRGERIPPDCIEPRLLQYAEIASFGTQLTRLFRVADREQVAVFFHDDFRQDPASVYGRILGFLGLPDCGRTSFPKVNVASQPRSRRMQRLLQNRLIRTLRRQAKSSLSPKWAGRFGALQSRLLFRTVDPVAVDADLRSEIAHFFEQEVSMLSDLLATDLARSWTSA